MYELKLKIYAHTIIDGLSYADLSVLRDCCNKKLELYLSNGLTDSERQLLQSNQRLAAIRDVRIRLNLSLKEAIEFIDKFNNTESSEPESLYGKPRKKGR